MSTPSTPTPTAPASHSTQNATSQNPKGPAVTPTPSGQTQNGNQQQPPARMMKIKVDGKEVEMSEKEVLELASAGKSSNQRFQEAAKLRREAEQVLKFAKENPVEFFQKTGMNARQWAEQYLMTELQKEAESPEQKKARENEEKLKKLEAQDKQRKDSEMQEQIKRATNMERERLEKLFTKALMDSGLPRTKFTVKRMAELQLVNIKNKFELPPEKLAQIVREDYINEQKSLLGSLEGDQLLDFLGSDLVKKFSKAQIAKLKARGTGGSTQKKTDKAPEEPGLSWREYQKRNRRRPA